WAAEVYVQENDLWRVTLTAPLLNQAALAAFLVSGAGKAEVLHEVLEGPLAVSRLPAQLIRPTNGDLRWLVDRAGAAKVEAVPQGPRQWGEGCWGGGEESWPCCPLTPTPLPHKGEGRFRKPYAPERSWFDAPPLVRFAGGGLSRLADRPGGRGGNRAAV